MLPHLRAHQHSVSMAGLLSSPGPAHAHHQPPVLPAGGLTSICVLRSDTHRCIARDAGHVVGHHLPRLGALRHSGEVMVAKGVGTVAGCSRDRCSVRRQDGLGLQECRHLNVGRTAVLVSGVWQAGVKPNAANQLYPGTGSVSINARVLPPRVQCHAPGSHMCACPPKTWPAPPSNHAACGGGRWVAGQLGATMRRSTAAPCAKC